MKEFIVKISEENSQLATQLLERLGAEVEFKKEQPQKIKKKTEKISPTFLFGKWKNLNIDAKKIRKDSWDRSSKSL